MNSWKKLRTGISIGIVVLILCGVAIVFVPIRDAVYGVPFDFMMKPVLLESGFHA